MMETPSGTPGKLIFKYYLQGLLGLYFPLLLCPGEHKVFFKIKNNGEKSKTLDRKHILKSYT